MGKFIAIEWYYNKNIGTVAVVKNNETVHRKDHHLLNEIVLIDGEEYTIIGVESYLRPIIFKGEKIGLLVSKENVIKF